MRKLTAQPLKRMRKLTAQPLKRMRKNLYKDSYSSIYLSKKLLSLHGFENTFYKTIIVLLWFIHTKCSRCAA